MIFRPGLYRHVTTDELFLVVWSSSGTSQGRITVRYLLDGKLYTNYFLPYQIDEVEL